MNKGPKQGPRTDMSDHTCGANPGPLHLGKFAGAYLAFWAQTPMEIQVLKKYFNVYENPRVSALTL